MNDSAPGRFLAALLLAGLAVAAAGAAEITRRQGPATVTLSGSRQGPDGLEVRLSDVARLTLEIEGQAPLKVEPPAKLSASAAWHATPAGPAVTTSLPGGRERWRRTFDLEPLEIGPQPLTLAPVTYHEGPGPEQTAKWPPFSVVVTTSVQRPDVSAAHDITSIEELPPGPAWLVWLVGGGAGFVALALAVALWLLWRRRLPRALPLPPDRAALRELDRLAALDLASPADVERFHRILANLIRRYLDARFQLPAGRQTTAEFLQTVRQSEHLTADQRDLLRDFLERCDLAKFAPVTPSPEECRAAADLGRRLVEETSRPLAPRSAGP
jgi:hypothetical protein